METLLVLTNCPDEETANSIALAVVEAKVVKIGDRPRFNSLWPDSQNGYDKFYPLYGSCR